MFVRHGSRRRRSHVVLGTQKFVARGFPLGTAGTRVFAIEPVAAIDAGPAPNRPRLLLLAALTLAVVAGLALRLARPLLRLFGERDVAGRYGREEIVLVLPGTPLLGGRRLSERIRRSLEEANIQSPDGRPISVTASFGGVVPDPRLGGAPACGGRPCPLRGQALGVQPRHHFDGEEEARGRPA